MRIRYRITPEGRGRALRDEEILRYRDRDRLMRNYVKARDMLHRRPLYRDRRAFLALLLIVLVALLVAEAIEGVHPVNDGPAREQRSSPQP